MHKPNGAAACAIEFNAFLSCVFRFNDIQLGDETASEGYGPSP
jgi:hypothetical protein